MLTWRMTHPPCRTPAFSHSLSLDHQFHLLLFRLFSSLPHSYYWQRRYGFLLLSTVLYDSYYWQRRRYSLLSCYYV
ncbi:hypothetical protein BDQ12DRAFT_685527 [Crucibulum laeve]|uniref:Uncharacterized protein n=1 Tax=Crucibulum laeve TaxID=68775 RepID=A0A5C3LYL8_9AGAR|nr:hypothetical protein BDQ12DRAFT_685527 [Crucibulum laeve]